MNHLISLQNQFQSYLMNGHSEFQKSVVSTAKVPAEKRLAIYANAYRARLMDALASNYPILYQYLGTTSFEKMANNYLSQYPSHFRSIRWFGDQLPDFLNHHDQYKTFPYLSELAQFEWLQTLVFDSADSPTIKMEEIAAIPPESWADMRLHVHPTLHRLHLSWNVVQIWQSISDNQSPDEPIKNVSSSYWILWRRDLINRFCLLSEDEAWAINALFREATFGELCEGLCQWVEEDIAGQHAASFLKKWIQSGILRGVTLTMETS